MSMDNVSLIESSDKTFRYGVTESQWKNLEASQKFNWRIAILGIVALAYFILYVATVELMNLGGLPKWLFHVIGIYSSCCFLLLTAGERELSKLSKWQINAIDTVWKIGGSLLFLTSGILFVVFLSSVLFQAVVPIMAETFPKGLGPEWLGTVLISIILMIAIYIKFKGFLIGCFRIPQIVGQHWKFAEQTGSVVPLAKIESTLAIAFSVGHVAVSCFLSALFAVWT